MNAPPHVELINLGAELLLGLRANTHLSYLGEQLARHDLPLTRNSVIPDHPETIARLFPEIWKHADILITTGGLGPTSDDNTREIICQCLGLELVRDAEAERQLRAFLSRRGAEPTENQLRQCAKPAEAEFLSNAYGTAPGLYLRHEGKLLIMLPGPSHEMRAIFDNEVLPRLVSETLASQRESFISLRTFGLPESEVERLIVPVLKAYSDISPAYCVGQGMVDLRLDAFGKDIPWVKLRKAAEACREALHEHFIGFDASSIAQVVIDQLRSMDKTLATAESCTGGLLANTLTDIPGASKVFAGGSVCYCDDAKVEILGVPESLIQQHGSVSAECVMAMATGAAERFNADYGLALTGYAGPGGGTPDAPVGTIYVGYHSPIGVWAQKITCSGDRLAVKGRAANAAFDMMRRKLSKYKLVEFLCMESHLNLRRSNVQD